MQAECPQERSLASVYVDVEMARIDLADRVNHCGWMGGVCGEGDRLPRTR
jgi:hypothetical protein